MCNLCTPWSDSCPAAEVVALLDEPSYGRRLGSVKATKADAIAEACKPNRLQVVMDPVLLTELDAWTAGVFADLGVTGGFNMLDPAVIAHLKNASATRVVGINKTTQKLLRKAVSDGFLAGESAAEIGKRIGKVFKGRTKAGAVRIARTEGVHSSNFGTFEAHKQSGIVKKRRWVVTHDGRARGPHLTLGSRPPIGIKAKFRIRGRSAWHPGGFGVSFLDINCRCTTVAVIRKDLTDAQLAMVWRAYDKSLRSWEAAIRKAVRSGLKKQLTDVMKVARRVL